MNTVIHIGTHKTGTKTLQRNLFSNLHQRRCLSEPLPVQPELEELFNRIKFQDSLSFDTAKADALVSELKRKKILGTDDSPVLISDEVFVTPSLGRGRTADPGAIAERLREYIGPAKILFVVRSQPSILPSLYTQFMPRNARNLNQKVFERRILESMNDQLFGMMHALRYDRLAQRYASLFGTENVRVVPFEILVKDPASYYRQICEFIDEPFDDRISEFYTAQENARPSKGTLIWDKAVPIYESLRVRFNLGRPSQRWPFIKPDKIRQFVSKHVGSKPFEISVPSHFDEMLRQFYGRSNRHLEELFGLDLEQYGYPMPLPGQTDGDEDKSVGLGGWTLIRF